MEKTPRYTQRERNMVLGYAARHKDIIENKRTDAESNRKKDEVWLQIAKEFNMRAYHQRSAKQLRQLYKNMKLLLKKDLSGEDRGNRAFIELLNTLASQDSVTQYITEQMSPDSGGGVSFSGLGNGGGSGAGDGRSGLHDDYDDSKMHFDDTDVILIKSETISDNEQENMLHGMDEDDDDDCLSPKAPEVCLTEEDEELFATDLRQLNQHNCNSNGSSRHTSTPSGHSCQMPNASLMPLSQSTTPNSSAKTTPTPITTLTLAALSAATGTVSGAAASTTATTTNTITSAAQATLFANAKPEITVQNVGGIRVGAFASLSKTLQNGTNSLLTIQQSVNSPGGNGLSSSGSISGASDATNQTQQQLTPEQVQQHLLLNGLGLSAVHPPASILPALNPNANATQSGQHSPTNMNNNQTTLSSSASQSATTTTTAALPIGRHTRSSDALQLSTLSGNNNNNGLTNGKHMLLNGHGNKFYNSNHHHTNHSHHQQTQQQQHHHHHHHQQQQQQQQLHSINSSNNSQFNHSGGSSTMSTTTAVAAAAAATTKSQHNEYLMKLTIEERERKIALLNAQIDYWKTLTKKLDANSGHFPTPSCLCHFPGNAANGFQTQASSS